jgi:hypothetical protein
VDIATWVPFFDSGARLAACRARGHVNGIRSGGHYFPSAHLCVRPSLGGRYQSQPFGTFLVFGQLLDLILYVLVGGLSAIMERYLPKQATRQSRPRTLPQ